MKPRRLAACRLRDGRQDDLRLAPNLALGEPQDAEALCCQPRITLSVADRIMEVLAVRFYDQPMPQAQEVDDEATERNLPAELQLLQPRSRSSPQSLASIWVGARRMRLASANFRTG